MLNRKKILQLHKLKYPAVIAVGLMIVPAKEEAS